PVLGVYDAGCKVVAHMEKHLPGVLQNRGRPTRLGDDGDGEPAPTPRVVLPALAHLGSNSASSTVEAPQVSLPVPPKRDSKVDVYALKAAAQGDRVQSQVNVYDLLHASAETHGPVPKAVNLAATRAVAALREAGIRVISLFEVLIFTYVWLRNIAEDEPGMLELGATG
ncbi:unnamed protein product, partial [Ectocarpus sp. 13 AM-2016]